MKDKVLIIAGPTAVGKTKYAIEAARRFDGEIVSADSMQLYKFMDIGSAKPTKEERLLAKHHLVDEIDPREPFSVAEYQKRAKAAIKDILSRHKLPIVCGGTGLYLNSLIYDMNFSAPPSSESAAFRKELEDFAKREGNEALHRKLREKDEKAAERIHPNNVKKVIRALESAALGKKIANFSDSFVLTKEFDPILVLLDRNRDELYERINLRTGILFEKGLCDEVRSLLEMGLVKENISMKGIGYKEVIDYLEGKYDLKEAKRLVRQNTRRYAKRQLTWFRRYEDMHRIDISAYEHDEEAIEEMISWVKNRL
ncbi:MAG: tRNA (adenosine(37)-N6)-dimethylallyltransferase MiaA [Clostridia bacterium]|nr:tRNA (adenosine(37)-N6)-dimethylallyltransferase MiaA [Clostridia bacterium]